MHSFKNEKGGVLVLAAIVIGVLVGLAGLAFEATLGSAAISQAQGNAKLAALAAIEAYSSSDHGDNEGRINEALDAANEVAGWNHLVSNDQETANELSLTGDGETVPLLEPGRYYPGLTAEGENPCGDEDPPCFKKLIGSETASAFRVSGPLYGAIPTRMLRIFGQETLAETKVETVASIVPRHGCFVVDLSASMIRETHIQGATADGDNYAFNIDQADHASRFAGMNPTRPAGPSDPTKHYQDDYISITALSDTDYGSSTDHEAYHPSPIEDLRYTAGSLAGNYMVDVFRDENYQGPLPLKTVFDGVHSAIEMFESRAVSGDMVCIIFHDNFLAWPRITKLTQDFDYLKKITDYTRYELGDGSLDMTRGLGLMLTHGFFPAYGANTDLQTSVGEAMRQFANWNEENPAFPTNDFIVMIGDGLTTCKSCPSEEDALANYDINESGSVSWTDYYILDTCIGGSESVHGISCSDIERLDANGDGMFNEGDVNALYRWVFGACDETGCSNTFSFYDIAMNEFHDFVQYSVAPTRTPIHVILTGAHVGPHTLSISDGEGGCLTDSQARSTDQEFTHGTYYYYRPLIFSTASASSPFHEVNPDLYFVAKITGGIWGPLRPVYEGCNDDPCSTDDSSGRRKQDPTCRPYSEQMDDYMKEIMGLNPYVIVSGR